MNARKAPPDWAIVAGTAAAYAAVGWLALLIAIPPGYASPLYPSAGIAVAAALVFGRPALAGALIGSFAVNVVLSAARGLHDAGSLLWLPLVIGTGAAVQAGLGAWLVQRFVTQPLVLTEPRDILSFALLAAPVACLVSPTLATIALTTAGAVAPEQALLTWGTWWVGDTLGVLIGAPLVLTLVGEPARDWRPRRRTVGVPLLVSATLLGAATALVHHIDQRGLKAELDRQAERAAALVATRLATPIGALQALHGSWQVAGGLDARSFEVASRWWLSQPSELRALGLSQAVPRADAAAYELRVRSEGLSDFRVFEREGAAEAAADAQMVVIRHIAPREGNTAALGVNALSVPAARAAILRARETSAPAATALFRLTQAVGDERGFVIYLPLVRNQRFEGVLFATLRADRLLAGLASERADAVRWCLVDTQGGARVAGAPGCEAAPPLPIEQRRPLAVADRKFELRMSSDLRGQSPGVQISAWLFSVAGLLALSLLGALLLTMTGRARAVAAEVAARTREIEREAEERAQAEEALRDSERRLRTILDHVPFGVMFLDIRGYLVETNPRLAAMLGHSVERLRTMSVADIAHPDEEAENRRQLKALLEGREDALKRRLRCVTADGRVLWVHADVVLLRDAQARPQRLVAVVEDITEHLQLEESERKRAEAEASNRAKSEFVSRMSHELRTPLNAMIGFAQLLGLDRAPALAEHQQAWVAQIQRAGWHLLEMINETLDLARIESGAVKLESRPVALAPLVSSCVAMLAATAAQRGVGIVEQVQPDVSAMADETRLRQVLINLLSNAVKYNREGGSVHLVVERRDSQVAIEVRDTGLGMTETQLASLFEPYNRLGREGSGIEGTGIGLSISRRLAELMGGALEVRSAAGVGSAFTLMLPAAASDAARSAAAASEPGALPGYHLRRVHYIEDNETNIEVMRGILAQRPQVGLSVSTLGLDGLTEVRRLQPDLVLLDMQLPDISGLELLRHLKNDDAIAGIPVLVVSADATQARVQEALTLGAVGYQTKPLDVARFLAAVDEVLAGMETRWAV